MSAPMETTPVTYLNIGTATGFRLSGRGITSFNVYNGDTSNVLLISRSPSPLLSNSIPVQPLTNGTITGDGPWYAAAQSGTIASLTVSPSAQLSPSPGQVAVQISSQLVSAPLYTASNVTLPDLTAGGANQNVNLSAITPVSLTGSGLTGALVSFYSAYEILLQLQCANTASSGMVQVILSWFNQVTDTVPLQQVKWLLPANNPGAVTIVGSGPQRGNYLAVQIASQEPNGTATTTLVKFALTGSLRQVPSDNWQSDGVSFGGNSSAAKAYSNQLCIVNAATVPASGSIIRGCLLYAGHVKVFAENPGTTGTLVGTISQVGNPLGQLWHGAIPQNSAGASPTTVDLIFDRTPMSVSVQATTAVAATVNISIIADRL